MFTRHITRRLSAHLDGQLPPSQVPAAELHLRHCARCRAESQQVAYGMTLLHQLPLVEAPPAIWSSIERGLRDVVSRPHETPTLWWRWTLATCLVLALAGAAYWQFTPGPSPGWEVARLEGSPSVAATPIHRTARIAAGQWLETDARSRASLTIGSIGTVEVSPNTRLRIVTAQPAEHRLALASGQIQARISAPPKLFFVDTPSGTAVDLGCEYLLNTDERGFGLLRVTKGWVRFQWNAIDSLVPAGASCQIRPHASPGIPSFDDAPAALQHAIQSFDSVGADATSIARILSAARVRDTLTLWHLLSRVTPADRATVFNRIAALTPLPPGVSREAALKLDPQTLDHLREELAWTW